MMPPETCVAAPDGLADIEVCKTIPFQPRNKPLVQPNIFNRRTPVRQKLPETWPSFNRNGDITANFGTLLRKIQSQDGKFGRDDLTIPFFIKANPGLFKL